MAQHCAQKRNSHTVPAQGWVLFLIESRLIISYRRANLAGSAGFIIVGFFGIFAELSITLFSS